MMQDVARLIDEGEYLKAFDVLSPILADYPKNARAWWYFGVILYMTGQPQLARLAYEESNRLEPHHYETWVNLGRCYNEIHQPERAEAHFRKALSLDPDNLLAMVAMANSGVRKCDPAMVFEWAEQILAKDPDSASAHLDKGSAYLMQGNYAQGWPEYRWGMGVLKSRPIRKYMDSPEPVWDGTKGQKVIVYSEQGIGEEICWSNALLDACKDANITFDCSSKLPNLFARSFNIPVHGTVAAPKVEWAKQCDASISLSELQELYRYESICWDGQPYLKPDMERVIQWRALLNSLGPEPKIGLAWTGGKTDTQRRDRSTTLETWMPLLGKQVHFVSLEYRDCQAEIEAFYLKYGIKVHHWRHAVQTKDYDDTAALVSCLDAVVAVPTAVVHLSGALGVECHCILSPRNHFIWLLEGDRVPYYNSVKLYRRATNDWDKAVIQVADALDKQMRQAA